LCRAPEHVTFSASGDPSPSSIDSASLSDEELELYERRLPATFPELVEGLTAKPTMSAWARSEPGVPPRWGGTLELAAGF
jgi:hypothetical protein